MLSVPALTHDRILAAIDVGTNSIHMVIVHIQPSLPTFTVISKEKATVRLGDRDPKTGCLTPVAMDRATQALRRCQELANRLHAEDIVAVATSAVREAPNGRDFLQQIEEELGLTINLIAGQEEARRIYLGVLSGMSFNNQPHAIIDIGGGSTELILGDGHEPRSLSSTKIGAVRLTAEFVTTDPISSTEFGYLQAYVRGMLERPVEELLAQLQPGETCQLVGTSGTIEAVAMLHAREKLGMIPDPMHGYSLTLEDLRELVNRLRRMPYAERTKLPGMNERRAEIIVAGAVILQEAMTLLGMNSIFICERALREGVVVDWMLTHGLIEDRLRFQSSIRERSVLRTAQKFETKMPYSECIARHAINLFDQTQGVLHPWGVEERDLLWAAAMLHNCGHFVSHSSHHKHSYYLIRNSDLLGFTEVEIETIANLARYHRKSCPKKKHESYRNISSKKYRRVVDQLSPLLRLAVAMDRRQIGAIAQFTCEPRPEAGELRLHLYPRHAGDDCALELWSLDYKKGCFEEVYGLKLVPILHPDAKG
ncbi:MULTISPECIES: Ppx/GppA phosphatase family protein [unclassified Leptolyngbya]|uniref:Ppx/GppA phosphatase family protein n=1 Tax=unclassified Leptolyngbya TaxID=2650499 RepID=UPI001F54C32C|nr:MULTISPECIES: Ppx/GppA phosphatase family protein [unclassified Leptolyngbya]